MGCFGDCSVAEIAVEYQTDINRRVGSDLQRRGRLLQRATIVWNLAEVVITITLGVAAGSLALVAFGLDSLLEVFASTVVLWHMAGDPHNSHRDIVARRLVGAAFWVLALYLAIAATRALISGAQPESSPWGIGYLAVTAVVMFTLGSLKRRTGAELDSEPFLAEAHMTYLDGWLATAILSSLALNAGLGWWWADPAAALIISAAAAREALELTGPLKPRTKR